MSVLISVFKKINRLTSLMVVKRKLLGVIRNDRYKRFIILTRSRTGSNLLNSLLNSHSEVISDGEVFSKLDGRGYNKVLAEVFSRQPFFIKAKGFKIFYYHPMGDENSGIWDALQSFDDLYVIHLKRENILETLVSRKIAGIKNVWTETSNKKSSELNRDISVSFTIEELEEGFTQTRAWEVMGDRRFSNHRLLSLSYEELVNNRSSTFRKITSFLDIKFIEPKTTLVKQGRRSMRDIIENYDILKSAFSKTEWAWMFDD